MTAEADPTKTLEAYVSFDPAIDRLAMGANFDKHFGIASSDIRVQRRGDRNTATIRVMPGQRPTKFFLRPLTVRERVQCDSAPTPLSSVYIAFAMAFVRAELSPPLSTVAEAVFGEQGQMLDEAKIDYIAERVGIEAVYEMGTVAYSRTRLGPFGQPFALLPATSGDAILTLYQSLADTLPAPTAPPIAPTSVVSTSSTVPESTNPEPSDAPGNAIAPEGGGRSRRSARPRTAGAAPPSDGSTT